MSSPLTVLRHPAAKSLHFIGIQGSGMAPLAGFLAKYAQQNPHQIGPVSLQGSDRQKAGYLPAAHPFQVWGYHDPKHLSSPEKRGAAPVAGVVYSSAIAADHLERQEADSLHLPQWHRSQLLSALSSLHKRRIWVTGSNGKTTTTALLTHLLHTAGHDPSAVVGGGMLHQQRLGYRVGAGGVWVAEADESDGTHTSYHSDVAVITDATEDHLDYYGDLSQLLRSMAQFAAQCSTWVIVDSDDPRLVAAVRSSAPHLITVGTTDDALYRIAKTSSTQAGCTFELRPQKLSQHPTSLPPLPPLKGALPHLIGEHQCRNAAFAVLAAYASSYTSSSSSEPLSPTAVMQGCRSFQGVARRLERAYESPHLLMLDDYAHNPLKVRAACQAVRQTYPEAFLEVIWEAHKQHRFTKHLKAFAAALKEAQHIMLLPLYEPYSPLMPSSPPPSTEQIARKLRSAEPTLATIAPLQNTEAAAENSQALRRAQMRQHLSVILVLGAGHSYLAHQSILEHLKPSLPPA